MPDMKKTLFYLLLLIVMFQPVNLVRNNWVLSAEALSTQKAEKHSLMSKEMDISNGVNSVSFSLVVINNDALLNQTNLGSYLTVDVTGYSSSPEETDDDPFITASGKYVGEGIVAANFLPLGTKIRFPERFGNQIFVVEDRMNKRFYDKVDIWFDTKEEAKNFGVQSLKIEIL